MKTQMKTFKRYEMILVAGHLMVPECDETTTTTTLMGTLDGVRLTYLSNIDGCDVIDDETGELIGCIDESGQFTYMNEWAKQTCQTFIALPVYED